MAQESAITQQMRDAIGVESQAVTFDVEKGAIIKFAQAIGDDNPLFNDEGAARTTRYGGMIAPPTFLRSLRLDAVESPVRSPYPANLDGGSEWEYFAPVRPGDRISVTVKASDISERQGRLGTMLFIIREITYVNQFGETVATQKGTSISYDPSSGASGS